MSRRSPCFLGINQYTVKSMWLAQEHNLVPPVGIELRTSRFGVPDALPLRHRAPPFTEACRHRPITGAEGSLPTARPFIQVIGPNLNLIGSDSPISPGSITFSGLTNGLVISNSSADPLWLAEHRLLYAEKI